MCQRGGEGWGEVHSDDGMGVDDSVHVGNGSGICNSKRGGSMCVCGGGWRRMSAAAMAMMEGGGNMLKRVKKKSKTGLV